MRLGLTLAAAAASLLMAGAAEAMPAMPIGAQPDSSVTLVRDGCGFGAHQGRFGGCRLNYGWRGRMRAAAGRVPRGCPPGTHPTGRGFCRRNFR